MMQTYTLTPADSAAYLQGQWYRADIEQEGVDRLALIPPEKKDFVEVQLADGRTAFFILNGEVLDL